MPAVRLPYGSTSISIRVDPEDLAWVAPGGLSTDYAGLLPALRSSLRELTRGGSVLLADPTLPPVVKDFLKEVFSGSLRELVSFDLLNQDSKTGYSFQSACLLSCPHPDPLIGFRGLGENLFQFYPELWKEFTARFLEAAGSGRKIDLKPYLNMLCSSISLRLVTLTPLAGGQGVLKESSPIEAYEALVNLQSGFMFSTKKPVEILLISAGGSPFDDSLSRAMCVLPNCLQDAACDRVILAVEGLNGLGLPPDIIAGEDAESKMPLITKYIGFCKSLLKGRTVHVVSAIPGSLLNTMLDCRAHDTLLDAYRASRLFIPKGSKMGIVPCASYTVLRIESPEKGDSIST